MKKLIISLFVISFSLASNMSDVRLEILSQLQVLHEQKEEILENLKTEKNKEKILRLKEKLNQIENKINSLNKELKNYENNIPTAG